MQSGALPEFSALSGDAKFQALTAEELEDDPDREFLEFIQDCAATFPTDQAEFRILDFGCGRGTTVGRLRGLGWRAYGVEIEQKFIDAGAIVNAGNGEGFAALSLLDRTGRTSFPDTWFDAVISD